MRPLIQSFLFTIHLIILYLLIIPSIGDTVYEKCNSNRFCARYIVHGKDNSDGQWASFRKTLPIMTAAVVGTCLLRWFVVFLTPLASKIHQYVTLAVGLGFVVVLHGYHSLIVLAIAFLGFGLVKLLNGRRYSFGVIWVYAICVLLFKESYRIRHIFPFLSVLFDNNRYGGMYSWQFPANFLVLRIVSFGLDYTWMIRDAGSTEVSKEAAANEEASKEVSHRSDDDDTSTKLPLIMSRSNVSDDYDFITYLAYILYAPLYSAGPILCYYDYVQQIRQPPSIPKGTFLYIIRFALCFLLMEYLTGRFPFLAVANSGLFQRLTASEIVIVFYGTLKLMWLKFLIIWRFFRMWAMLDGISAPENMKTCMSNNCSLLKFWKGWHSSYNAWLIRYVYVPLGGSSSYIAVWMIFLFVAIWHDIEWKLIVWGLLNASFYTLEVGGRAVSMSATYQSWLPAISREFIATCCSAFYIMVLIFVNLIGYSVGMGGVSVVASKLLTTFPGLVAMGTSFYFLVWGVLFMNFIEFHRKSHSHSQ